MLLQDKRSMMITKVKQWSQSGLTKHYLPKYRQISSLQIYKIGSISNGMVRVVFINKPATG